MSTNLILIETSLRARHFPWEKKIEKNILKKIIEKKFEFFYPLTSSAPHERPQKKSTQSVQPFGRL